jgi:ribokinase
VVGYASLDTSTTTDRFAGVDATTVLSGRLSGAHPAVGGIAHLTRAATRAGAVVEAVSWVGDDPFGDRWRSVVAADGTGTQGVLVRGNRSPSASLVHVGTGGTLCFYDPGDCHGGPLTTEQAAVLASCPWVLLTVGPAEATWSVLAGLPATTRLAWAVKRDEQACPPDLVAALLDRADVVSCSEGELAWLSPGTAPLEHRARPGALLVTTRGGAGATWSVAGPGPVQPRLVPVTAVADADPTGAGDTFLGVLVAELAHSGSPDPDRAVTTAAAAATAFVRSRAPTAPPAPIPSATPHRTSTEGTTT